MKRPGTLDAGVVLESGCRLMFVVATMFVGYRLVVECSKSVYLHDYFASLYPDGPSETVCDDEQAHRNCTHDPKREPKRMTQWPLYPIHANETDVLLRQLIDNQTLPCYQRRTFGAQVFGLPKPSAGQPVQLQTGKLHNLLIVSFEEDGARRCAGGDFFETDLKGPNWRARPPTIDNQDGSYGLTLMVDPRFAGRYVFEVILSFSNFHAMGQDVSAWARLEKVLTVEIEFAAPTIDDSGGEEMVPDLRRCTEDDFSPKAWSGRWSRTTWNRSCEINDDGRFKCIEPSVQCDSPWCDGPVGLLESNGWVYSAHCKFKIFEQEEAWDCLDGRWLFFWGDSNNEDNVRNLLNFVLGFPLEEVKHMRRWFDGKWSHPTREGVSVRISKIFNGHEEEAKNLHGLYSLQNETYRQLLRGFFTGIEIPDTVVMNSGLHDSHFYMHVKDFAEEGVEYAATFWEALWRGTTKGGLQHPDVIYRTTVAGAGYRERFGQARDGLANAHKMESYNRIFVERLQQLHLKSFKVVDALDLTFPWHYDFNHTDGVHYGRAPSKSLWKGVQIGHQYFVDVMLAHILLNAMCLGSNH